KQGGAACFRCVPVRRSPRTAAAAKALLSVEQKKQTEPPQSGEHPAGWPKFEPNAASCADICERLFSLEHFVSGSAGEAAARLASREQAGRRTGWGNKNPLGPPARDSAKAKEEVRLAASPVFCQAFSPTCQTVLHFRLTPAAATVNTGTGRRRRRVRPLLLVGGLLNRLIPVLQALRQLQLAVRAGARRQLLVGDLLDKWALAKQLDEVLLVDALPLQQAVSHGLHLGSLLSQQRHRVLPSPADQQLHLLVNEGGGGLGERLLEALLLLRVAQVAELVAEAQLSHLIVLGTVRELVEEHLLSSPAAHRHHHLLVHHLRGHQVHVPRLVLGVAKRFAPGNDADLKQRIAVFKKPPGHGVTGLVHADCALLLRGQHLAGAGNDAVNGGLEVLPVDGLVAVPGGDQRSLVAHIGDVRPREAGSPGGQLLRQILGVQTVVKFQRLLVDTENGGPAFDVRQFDVDLAVEPAGPQQGRVQHVDAVRGGQHHHVGFGVEACGPGQEDSSTGFIYYSPSISTSSWFSVFSCSLLPPKLRPDRLRPMASISSMNRMQGALRRAVANMSRTRLGPTPTNISWNSEPLTDRNGTLASPAVALASRVLPVPGGPFKMAPRGILAPSARYCSGRRRKLTNSIISVLASSQPATSLKPTLIWSFSTSLTVDWVKLPNGLKRDMPPPCLPERKPPVPPRMPLRMRMANQALSSMKKPVLSVDMALDCEVLLFLYTTLIRCSGDTCCQSSAARRLFSNDSTEPRANQRTRPSGLASLSAYTRPTRPAAPTSIIADLSRSEPSPPPPPPPLPPPALPLEKNFDHCSRRLSTFRWRLLAFGCRRLLGSGAALLGFVEEFVKTFRPAPAAAAAATGAALTVETVEGERSRLAVGAADQMRHCLQHCSSCACDCSRLVGEPLSAARAQPSQYSARSVVVLVLVEVPQAAVAADVRPRPVQVDVHPRMPESRVAAVAVDDAVLTGDWGHLVHEVDGLLLVDQLLLAHEPGQAVVARLKALPGAESGMSTAAALAVVVVTAPLELLRPRRQAAMAAAAVARRAAQRRGRSCTAGTADGIGWLRVRQLQVGQRPSTRPGEAALHQQAEAAGTVRSVGGIGGVGVQAVNGSIATKNEQLPTATRSCRQQPTRPMAASLLIVKDDEAIVTPACRTGHRHPAPPSGEQVKLPAAAAANGEQAVSADTGQTVGRLGDFNWRIRQARPPALGGVQLPQVGASPGASDAAAVFATRVAGHQVQPVADAAGQGAGTRRWTIRTDLCREHPPTLAKIQTKQLVAQSAPAKPAAKSQQAGAAVSEQHAASDVGVGRIAGSVQQSPAAGGQVELQHRRRDGGELATANGKDAAAGQGEGVAAASALISGAVKTVAEQLLGKGEPHCQGLVLAPGVKADGEIRRLGAFLSGAEPAGAAGALPVPDGQQVQLGGLQRKLLQHVRHLSADPQVELDAGVQQHDGAIGEGGLGEVNAQVVGLEVALLGGDLEQAAGRVEVHAGENSSVSSPSVISAGVASGSSEVASSSASSRSVWLEPRPRQTSRRSGPRVSRWQKAEHRLAAAAGTSRQRESIGSALGVLRRARARPLVHNEFPVEQRQKLPTLLLLPHRPELGILDLLGQGFPCIEVELVQRQLAPVGGVGLGRKKSVRSIRILSRSMMVRISVPRLATDSAVRVKSTATASSQPWKRSLKAMGSALSRQRVTAVVSGDRSNRPGVAKELDGLAAEPDEDVGAAVEQVDAGGLQHRLGELAAYPGNLQGARAHANRVQQRPAGLPVRWDVVHGLTGFSQPSAVQNSTGSKPSMVLTTSAAFFRSFLRIRSAMRRALEAVMCLALAPTHTNSIVWASSRYTNFGSSSSGDRLTACRRTVWAPHRRYRRHGGCSSITWRQELGSRVGVLPVHNLYAAAEQRQKLWALPVLLFSLCPALGAQQVAQIHGVHGGAEQLVGGGAGPDPVVDGPVQAAILSLEGVQYNVAIAAEEHADEVLLHRLRVPIVDLPDLQAGDLAHQLVEYLAVVQVRLAKRVLPAARLHRLSLELLGLLGPGHLAHAVQHFAAARVVTAGSGAGLAAAVPAAPLQPAPAGRLVALGVPGSGGGSGGLGGLLAGQGAAGPEQGRLFWMASGRVTSRLLDKYSLRSWPHLHRPSGMFSSRLLAALSTTSRSSLPMLLGIPAKLSRLSLMYSLRRLASLHSAAGSCSSLFSDTSRTSSCGQLLLMVSRELRPVPRFRKVIQSSTSVGQMQHLQLLQRHDGAQLGMTHFGILGQNQLAKVDAAAKLSGNLDGRTSMDREGKDLKQSIRDAASGDGIVPGVQALQRGHGAQFAVQLADPVGDNPQAGRVGKQPLQADQAVDAGWQVAIGRVLVFNSGVNFLTVGISGCVRLMLTTATTAVTAGVGLRQVDAADIRQDTARHDQPSQHAADVPLVRRQEQKHRRLVRLGAASPAQLVAPVSAEAVQQGDRVAGPKENLAGLQVALGWAVQPLLDLQWPLRQSLRVAKGQHCGRRRKGDTHHRMLLASLRSLAGAAITEVGLAPGQVLGAVIEANRGQPSCGQGYGETGERRQLLRLGGGEVELGDIAGAGAAPRQAVEGGGRLGHEARRHGDRIANQRAKRLNSAVPAPKHEATGLAERQRGDDRVSAEARLVVRVPADFVFSVPVPVAHHRVELDAEFVGQPVFQLNSESSLKDSSESSLKDSLESSLMDSSESSLKDSSESSLMDSSESSLKDSSESSLKDSLESSLKDSSESSLKDSSESSLKDSSESSLKDSLESSLMDSSESSLKDSLESSLMDSSESSLMDSSESSRKDSSESSLKDSSESSRKDSSESSLKDSLESSLKDSLELSLKDSSESSLKDSSESSLKDSSESSLKDSLELSLKDSSDLESSLKDSSESSLKDSSESSLMDSSESSLKDSSESSLKDSLESSLMDSSESSLKDSSESSLMDSSESSLKDSSESSLKDSLESSLKDKSSLKDSSESSLKDSSESSLKDSLESSLMDSSESSLKDSLESRQFRVESQDSSESSRKDSSESSLKDSSESSRKDSSESSLKDSSESSRKDSSESSLKDSLESSLKDSLESSLKDSLESSLKDSSESSRKDSSESSLKDSSESSLKDSLESSLMDSSESSLKDSSESSLMDSSESSRKDSSESSLKDSSESSRKDSSESSLKDSSESSRKDSSESSLKDSSESSRKDSSESSLKDSLESSLKDSLESSLKDSLESSLKDSSESSRKDSSESSLKDSSESSLKDSLESSLMDSSESSLKDSLESSLMDSSESSRKDSSESSLKDSSESSRKDSSESSLKDSSESSRKDSSESSLKDSLESSLKDSLESSLKDSLESSLKDSSESSRKDSSESSLKDSLESSLKDSLESSLKDSSESGLKDS
uniref:Secreted protein n=1 Tax=Macrostomum lignano TaxID=282301 RepID=A0A1I8FYD2_9PLAT